MRCCKTSANAHSGCHPASWSQHVNLIVPLGRRIHHRRAGERGPAAAQRHVLEVAAGRSRPVLADVHRGAPRGDSGVAGAHLRGLPNHVSGHRAGLLPALPRVPQVARAQGPGAKPRLYRRGKSLCAMQPLDTCRLAMLSGTSSRREMRLTDVLGLCAGVHTLCQLRAVCALPGGHLHLSDIRPPGCSLWCGHDFTPMSFREHGRCM